MAKPRPRTGEKRAVNQPLKIDKLPQEVRDAIQALRQQQTVAVQDAVEEVAVRAEV